MMMFRKMLLSAGLLTSMMAVASADADVGYPHIEVIGYGKAAAMADRCCITVVVSVAGKDLPSARKTLDEQVKKLIDAVRKAVPGKTEIGESELPMLNERIFYFNRRGIGSNGVVPNTENPVTVAARPAREYDLSKTVFIRTGELGRINEIVDLASSSGVNAESRVEFISSRQKTLDRDAMTAACRDAAERAQVLAAAMNVELTEPTVISESFEFNEVETPVPNNVLQVESRKAVKVIYRIFNKKK